MKRARRLLRLAETVVLVVLLAVATAAAIVAMAFR